MARTSTKRETDVTFSSTVKFNQKHARKKRKGEEGGIESKKQQSNFGIAANGWRVCRFDKTENR